MRRTERLSLRRTLLVLGLLLLLAAPAHALRLRGGGAADRAAARPLRELQLPAVLDGIPPASPSWIEAARKLPRSCKQATVTPRSACDDTLRCAWLANRGAVAAAWQGRGPLGKEEAAARLHRIANLLAAESQCGRKPEKKKIWEADKAQAARDDALVSLALLVELRKGGQQAVLDQATQRRVAKLVATARDKGLDAVDGAALVAERQNLHEAWLRGSWLAKHPVIARLRTTVPALWKPAGGVPDGCGRELQRHDLLDDQWRGYLVREVVPRAMRCLDGNLTSSLARKGYKAKDPGEGKLVAEVLATVASRDAGGRSFGSDTALYARIDALEQAYQAIPQAVKKKSPPRKTTSTRAANKPRSTRKKSSGSSNRNKGSARPAGAVDQQLVQLAERVAVYVADGKRLVNDARRARGETARERSVEELVVALHRTVCAPLEQVDLDDLDRVRVVLSDAGVRADEQACLAVAGRASLEELLDAAPGLRRLHSAATLRVAARQVVRDRPDAAIRLLDRVPDEYRGTTWSLLYAWAARKDGDPVTAGRMLARIDEATLDRLRASGSEEVARLVAHAWVSDAP